MEIAIQTKDERLQGDPRLVGTKEGMPRWKIETDSEVTTVVYEALKREFENNGHTVVKADEPAQWIIQVDVRRYWSQPRIQVATEDLVGSLAADVTIRDGRDDAIILTAPIESVFVVYNAMGRKMPALLATGMLTFGIATPFHVRSAFREANRTALNGALAEFVRQFSRDSRILEALQSARKKQGWQKQMMAGPASRR